MRKFRGGVHIFHLKVLGLVMLLLVAVIAGTCAGDPAYRLSEARDGFPWKRAPSMDRRADLVIEDQESDASKPESTEAMCAGVDTRVDGQGRANRPGQVPIDWDEGGVK